MRETNGNFDSCNSHKRLIPSRLHELHKPKFQLVSRSAFIRSKLLIFSAHVSGRRGYRAARFVLPPISAIDRVHIFPLDHPGQAPPPPQCTSQLISRNYHHSTSRRGREPAAASRLQSGPPCYLRTVAAPQNGHTIGPPTGEHH